MSFRGLKAALKSQFEGASGLKMHQSIAGNRNDIRSRLTIIDVKSSLLKVDFPFSGIETLLMITLLLPVVDVY